MFEDQFIYVLLMLISIIALYAGYCLLTEYKNLKNEQSLLNSWRSKLANFDNGQLESALESLCENKRIHAVSQVNRKKFTQGAQRERLVDQAVRSVWQGRNSNADLEAISSMLSQRESGRLSFPYAAPNLCMLMGLFGTVLGLALTVPELSKQIQQATTAADPKLLGTSLGATLSNMQSAFYATLFGVLGALAVGFSTRHVAHKQNEFVAEVQDFIITMFGPRVLPQNKEATVEDLAKALKDIRLTIRQIPAMMESAANTFGDALASSGKQMSETLQGLQDVSTQIQSSLASAAGDVRGSAERLSEATSAVASASNGLQAYHQDLTSSHRAMLELFVQSRAELELQISAQLSSISGFQEQVMRSTSEIVSKIVDATQAFQSAGTNYHEAASDSTKRVTEFRESVAHGFGELATNVNDVFKQHQQGLNRVSAELVNLAGKFDPILLDQEWRKIQESIGGLDQSVASLGSALQQAWFEDIVSATRAIQALAGNTLESVTPFTSAPSYVPPPATGSMVDEKIVAELKAAITDLRDGARVLTVAANAISNQQRAFYQVTGALTQVRDQEHSKPSNDASPKRQWFGFLKRWRR